MVEIWAIIRKDIHENREFVLPGEVSCMIDKEEIMPVADATERQFPVWSKVHPVVRIAKLREVTE